MKMARMVRDYDEEAIEYLLSRPDLDFTRREVSQSVQFIICRDGVELGRLTFAPVKQGFGGEVQISVHASAIVRGSDVSFREHGTVIDIPDEERERHREFIAICKRIEDRVEFIHNARERFCLLDEGEGAEPTLAGEGAGDHQEIEQIPFSGFPQTQEKREEWAEIYYDVIVPLREKHRRERNSMLPYCPPDDPDLPDLEPTWKECREEIVSQKETSYQESTIRRMIRAGDNKDLQEYRVGK